MSRTSRTKALRFAASGAIALALLTGCASSGSRQMARAGDHAERYAAKQGHAVAIAERAVEKNPNDAALRFALGQAYIEAGRFASAATSFQDAISLGDASGRTQLNLALARIGAGDGRGAIDVLDGGRDTIPASDRGLALALAGESGRGVAILLDKLRGGENSPKLRQNLAYAYALDGQWREARIAMAQDVPADQIDDRIGQWAMMAQPEAVQRRVASLLAVPAGVADAGQPAALALGAAPQVEQFAEVEAAAPAPVSPAPVSPMVQTAATELPPVDAAPAVAPVPAPTSFAAAFAAPPQAAYAVPEPVAGTIPAPAAYRKSAGAPRGAAAPVPAVTLRQGGHMVQLGSFSSEANARRAIRVYTARNPELRNLRMTITPAVVNGKNFWRVAAADLDSGSALRLCSGLKNRGGACFAYAADRAPLGSKPMLAWFGAGPAKARHR